MKKDKRIEKNIESIKNIQKLLIDICKNPALFADTNYLIILKSQGGLAKIEDNDLGISSSSINTLKRICEKEFEGGFEQLDKMRIMAYDCLFNFNENGKSSNKINKIGLSKRVSELEEQIESLQKAHLLSMNIFMEDLKTFKNIVENNSMESIKHLSKESISRIQTLAVYSPLFLQIKDSSNVVNIKSSNYEKN